jgi:hypothetical protein
MKPITVDRCPNCDRLHPLDHAPGLCDSCADVAEFLANRKPCVEPPKKTYAIRDYDWRTKPDPELEEMAREIKPSCPSRNRS